MILKDNVSEFLFALLIISIPLVYTAYNWFQTLNTRYDISHSKILVTSQQKFEINISEILEIRVVSVWEHSKLLFTNRLFNSKVKYVAIPFSPIRDIVYVATATTNFFICPARSREFCDQVNNLRQSQPM